jgi:hypothetical protein
LKQPTNIGNRWLEFSAMPFFNCLLSLQHFAASRTPAVGLTGGLQVYKQDVEVHNSQE